MDQLKEFQETAEAFDQILKSRDATIDWIAIPALHLLSARHQPFRPRIGITRHQVALLVDLFRGLATRQKEFPPSDLGPVDVLIVSWLINIEHLNDTDDFYFGNLQQQLARRGLSSLLMLRNQTNHPTATLIDRARRDGTCSRLMIPDVPRVAEQLSMLRRCWYTSRAIRRAATNAATREIPYQAISSPTVQNLSLCNRVAELCKRTNPSVLITLYEGHAWERCVWHAARMVNSGTLCVGYQHTILRQHSHAVKRSLNMKCDPDVVLTLGRVPRRILESSPRLKDVRLLTFGTHRYKPKPPERGPRLKDTFLVLPEGITSECLFLFGFALQCARRLPEVRFIFRTHPILPFEKVERKLLARAQSWPENVEVSRNISIEHDFDRAGNLLYRGSSTVIYGVLAGLKPFYVSQPGELTVDPLYELKCWREHVGSAEDLLRTYRAHQSRSINSRAADWSVARDYCADYVHPVQESAIDEMLELAGLKREVLLTKTQGKF